MAPRRNRRAGVSDRWNRRDGHPTERHGIGLRWLARYVADDGRERTKAFGRKTDAQRWLDRQVSDQVTGTWTDPELSAITFGTMAERWLETKATRAPKTVAGYRSLLDGIVLPRWRDIPLRNIGYADLQTWITELSAAGSVRFEGKGLSASRVRQVHQLVGAVCKFAVRAKSLPSNPADGVELPRLPEVEQRYLTHQQLHEVAVAAGPMRTMILVLGYCGLRLGEATALRVSDIDTTACRIRVARSVTPVRGAGLTEGPPKNHTSRSVPIPAFLARLLETELADRAPDEVAFPGRDGGYVTPGAVWWKFSKAAAAVEGCAGTRIHDLRHTAASLAVSAGANIKVLQRMLGHKTAVLTLDRYSHLFGDDLDAVATALDRAAVATADQLRTSKRQQPTPHDGNTV
jgi:integrase